MAKYILKRVGFAAMTLLCVFVITFFMMNAVPGSPFVTESTPIEAAERLEEKYGLNDPLGVQLWRYFTGYLKGDFGVSLVMSLETPIYDLLFTQGRFANSAKLAGLTLIITLGLGIPLGAIAAYNRGKMVDHIVRVCAVAFSSIPGFVFATACLMLFVVKLGWLSATSGRLESWQAYVMPLICMCLGGICGNARAMRTSMLDVMGSDYIRTARAKGCKTSRVIFVHCLRNSLIPVLTGLGGTIAGLLTGSLIVEKTFIIPGMGVYMTSSISARDYPVIMATTIIFAALLVFFNLLVDLAYVVVDPRITFTSKGD